MKDKSCARGQSILTFSEKNEHARQIEAAQNPHNANNFSVVTRRHIAGNTTSPGATPETPTFKGMTAEGQNFGGGGPMGARNFHGCRKPYLDSGFVRQGSLHLTVVKGIYGKLITNDRVAGYMAQYQPEL